MTAAPVAAKGPTAVLRRSCACKGGNDSCHCDRKGKLRRHARGAGPATAPPIVEEVLNSPGHPLDTATRLSMEQRLGHDFSRVRVHTDAHAARSADAVAAAAYTVGSHVAFAQGLYDPGSPAGSRLLAHELAHVATEGGAATPAGPIEVGAADAPQEKAAEAAASGGLRTGPATGSTGALRRQLMHPSQVNPMDDPRMHPAGAPGSTTCGAPSHCPPAFCQPYSSASYAIHQRTRMLPVLMAGIALAVDSRVVPLWHDHLLGGSAPRDLSAQFAADFTASRSTARTNAFLVRELGSSVASSPPSFAPGMSSATEPVAARLASALAAIDTPGGPDEMNFNIPGEVPGNLAGGIGKNQTSCAAGARPSPFNDERTARGTVTIARGPGGFLVTPDIVYVVRDTIDLCPGDCGTSLEQVATVPISQFEATGISGDVPFTVEFPAGIAPFTVPAPGSPGVPAPAPVPAPPPVPPPVPGKPGGSP